ncbi:predicted coding region AF_1482 [Archaeoglobus fulgidus DSM 4304]|uniref:Uncharacterized protein AF_1482 n=1 Tax=Archaeoglobus fulgidus (strain ATCC 49558 / DSM 4304 / JCM 9628 / NBRC 100126 / VC-16) TaxID=224325 RepID=Y1482_ARCFU|nr:RecName: Full=Uncharacterized protein AF_1482 [Archaeoglobus fulgidus DSM 4304]AAB89770.1 predicted coding region AF_1482 [Archaeoglobus fulgidus DSM 4304]
MDTSELERRAKICLSVVTFSTSYSLDAGVVVLAFLGIQRFRRSSKGAKIPEFLWVTWQSFIKVLSLLNGFVQHQKRYIFIRVCIY